MNTNRTFKKAVSLITLSTFLVSNLAFAAPEGGSVAQGSATISQNQNQTVINQTSQAAVINWNSFNTASGEAVQFNQPNSSAVALNRITNGLPTQFAGSLTANGHVWILNPAGVLFTNTATVDVAGLVATTHGITDANFMSGNYKFDVVPGSENSKIINNGLISAKNSGIVALVAPGVENNGIIMANLGRVHLATGSAFTLDMYGDSLINFGSSAPIQNGSVSNSGLIKADGGKVYMTAKSASAILDNVISMSGTIEANAVSTNQKGEIVLHGGSEGTTIVSGKLHAKGGGHIETSGAHLIIEPSTEINAGVGGTWLIDPWNIEVVAGSGLFNNGGATGFVPSGSNSQIGATLIINQLNLGTNVTLDTGIPGTDLGNITVSSAITWSTAATLSLIAANNITINSVINGGANGLVNLTAGASIVGTGIITAHTLNTSSVTGTTLTGLNSGANFNATNTTSGAISYTHTGALNITGIAQAGGNLTITNTGAITQSGPISVSGTSSFTAGAGAITLTDPANNFVGAVTLSNSGLANNVDIFNNAALTLGASTIGNVLNVNTSGGNITLMGNITSGNSQTYNKPVLIGANLTLTATTGAINFTSTVNDTALRSHTLTISEQLLSGTPGVIGGITPLLALNLSFPVPSFMIDSTVASFIVSQLNVGTNVRVTVNGDLLLLSPITQTINAAPVTLSLGSVAGVVFLGSTISLINSTLSLTQASYTVNAALASFIEGQLNAGTNFILNSSSTITVSSPITQTVNAGNVTLSMLAATALNINQPITLITGGAFVATAPSGINLGANV